MGRIIENNQVRISGEMTSDFGFSHEVFGEGFYTAQITIRRESGQKDRILVMASERLVDVKGNGSGSLQRCQGRSVLMTGMRENETILNYWYLRAR